MFKALVLAAIVTGSIAVVLGSQGSTGGALSVHSLMIADYKMYWSWPLFFAGSGLSWGLILLQR